MTMITQAMRRVLSGDESIRALDPNGLRLRSSARLPRTVRARSPVNSISFASPIGVLAWQSVSAAALEAKCKAVIMACDEQLAAEGPTPYYREPLAEDAVLPLVVRGFA